MLRQSPLTIYRLQREKEEKFEYLPSPPDLEFREKQKERKKEN